MVLRRRTSLTSKEVLYWVFIIAIMFFPRRLEIGGVSSYRFGIIAALGYTLIGKHVLKIRMKSNILGISALLFFAFVVLRNFTNTSDGYGTMFGIWYVVDTLGCFWIFSSLIKTRKELDYFLEVYAKIVGIYSLLGIIECFTGFNLWNLISGTDLYSMRMGLYRSYGSATNYMNNGAILMLSLPLIFWKMQNSMNRGSKRKYLFIYILVLANILSGLTRTIILCVLLLHLIWGFKYGLFKLVMKHLRSIVLGCVLVVVAALLIPTISHAISNIFNMFLAIFNDEAASKISSTFGANVAGRGQRIELFTWVWNSVRKHLLIGLGPRGFAYTYVKNGVRVLKDSLENQYLVMLYYYGIIGLALYVMMILQFLYKLNVARKIEMLVTKREIVSANARDKMLPFLFLILSTVFVYFLSCLGYAAQDDFRVCFIVLGIASAYIKSMNRDDCVTPIRRKISRFTVNRRKMRKR